MARHANAPIAALQKLYEMAGPAATPRKLPTRAKRHVRALFLSDTHLGTHKCNAAAVLDFLDHHVADQIFLVGDIFDTWRPLGANWKPDHDAVLRELITRANEGVRIVYTPGNHDSFFRKHFGTYFGNVEVVNHLVHVTAEGRRMLVVHGDVCDIFGSRAVWLAHFGASMQNGTHLLNDAINVGLARLGKSEWHGLDHLVTRINGAIRAGDWFERRISRLAKDFGADGVICGHFHLPALHSKFGPLYANCGDWVEHATALIELPSGNLELVDWSSFGKTQSARPAQIADDTPVPVSA